MFTAVKPKTDVVHKNQWEAFVKDDEDDDDAEDEVTDGAGVDKTSDEDAVEDGATEEVQERDWADIAAALPENCSLLVHNFLNGDVDELLRGAKDNDVRRGAPPMDTSLAHMIWTLPGPRQPAAP